MIGINTTELTTNDRLGRDISAIMNSTFWIDALKRGFAHGIGEQLNFQLSSTHDFIRDFVKCFVEIRKFLFKNNIYLFNEIDLCNDDDFSKSDDTDFQNLELMTKFEDRWQYMQTFLIECSYLCLLDSNDFLGTTSSIANRIKEWFPDVDVKNIALKCKLEVLLKRSPYFKRLVNYDKANIKPIILEKRQKLWSIDSNYFKSFIRNFQRMQKVISISQFYPRNLISTFKLSLKVWKLKIEQLKLLMQIKHNGYLWLNNSNTKFNRSVLRSISDQKTPTKHERKTLLTIPNTQIYTSFLISSPQSPLINPICQTSYFQTASITTSMEHFFSEDLREDNDISLETFLF